MGIARILAKKIFGIVQSRESKGVDLWVMREIEREDFGVMRDLHKINLREMRFCCKIICIFQKKVVPLQPF